MQHTTSQKIWLLRESNPGPPDIPTLYNILSGRFIVNTTVCYKRRKTETPCTVSARDTNWWLQRTPWKTCRPGSHVCWRSARANRPRWSRGSRESSNRRWGRWRGGGRRLGECTVSAGRSGIKLFDLRVRRERKKVRVLTPIDWGGYLPGQLTHNYPINWDNWLSASQND